MKHLRDDLWVYGWRCLRAWMRDGTIIEKCGERDVPLGARYFEVEILKRRGDIRDEIAHKSVESAVWGSVDDLVIRRGLLIVRAGRVCEGDRGWPGRTSAVSASSAG